MVTLGGIALNTDDIQRFWAKTRWTASGCREWTASTDRKGYGQFRLGGRGGRLVRVHRVAWAIVHGDPGEFLVLHSCDNRRCLWTDESGGHLFLGTNLDNVRDMDAKGRRVTVVHFGEDHANAVLTRELVLEMRARNVAGEGYRNLAHRYGISRSTIAAAISGRNWGWL